MNDRLARRVRLSLCSLTILLAGTLWAIPLGSSLWLDETSTYFIVKRGFSHIISRNLAVGGSSPAYLFIAGTVAALGGKSEVALRLPSVIAAAAAALVFFRLAKRLLGDSGAWMAVLLFVTSSLMVFAADDARPYAFALLCLIGSSLCTIRWLDERTWKFGVAAILLACAAIYFHYLFALAIGAHLPFIYAKLGTRLRSMGLALLVGAIVLAPALPQIVALAHRRNILALPDVVTVATLVGVLLPPAILLGVPVGLAIARLFGPLSIRPAARSHTSLLAVSWLVLPPFALFVLAKFLGIKVFTYRYCVMSVPGLALVMAGVLTRLAVVRVRWVAFSAALCLSVATGFTPRHVEPVFETIPDLIRGSKGVEWDWRGTAKEVNRYAHSITPVLVDVGYAESRSIDYLTRPLRAAWLLSPSAFYPMRGTLIPVPSEVSASTDGYVRRILRESLNGSSGFILVTTNPNGPLRRWLDDHLANRFQGEVVWGVGATWVMKYDLRHPTKTP